MQAVPSVSVDDKIQCWALGQECKPTRQTTFVWVELRRLVGISFCLCHSSPLSFYLNGGSKASTSLPGMLTDLCAARRNRHRCRRRSCWPGFWSIPRTRGPVVEPDPFEIPRRLRRIPSRGCPAPPQHECCPQLSHRPAPGGGFPLRVLPPTRRCCPGRLCFAPDKPDECATPLDGCLALIPQVQWQEALVHTRRRPGIPTYCRKRKGFGIFERFMDTATVSPTLVPAWKPKVEHGPGLVLDDLLTWLWCPNAWAVARFSRISE